MLEKIIIKVQDKEIALTKEEAIELKRELNNLFNEPPVYIKEYINHVPFYHVPFYHVPDTTYTITGSSTFTLNDTSATTQGYYHE